MTKLVFSATPKIREFAIEKDGEIIDCIARQFTISDLIAQKPMFNEVNTDNKSDDVSKFVDYTRIRLVTCVKRVDTGEYMWPSVQSFLDEDYPSEMVVAIQGLVDELNPFPKLSKGNDNTIKSKKNV